MELSGPFTAFLGVPFPLTGTNKSYKRCVGPTRRSSFRTRETAACVAAGVPNRDGCTSGAAAGMDPIEPPGGLRWETIAGCKVVLPIDGPPVAIVHFIGGFGAGSAPDRFYARLAFETVKRAQVAVVCVALPGIPGFDHGAMATAAGERLVGAVGELRARFGFLHTIAAGHSLGARLQVIRACDRAGGGVIDAGSVLLCFNNFAARRAMSGADSISDAIGADAARTVGEAVAGIGSVLEGVSDIVVGLGRAFGDVAGGTATEARVRDMARKGREMAEMARAGFGGEFQPSPTELLEMVREKYAVGCTLVVSFERDSLDTSDEIVEAICAKFGETGVVRRRLSGTHVTPLTPEISEEMRRTGNEMMDRGIDVVAKQSLREFDEMVTCVSAFVRFILEEKIGRKQLGGGSER